MTLLLVAQNDMPNAPHALEEHVKRFAKLYLQIVEAERNAELKVQQHYLLLDGLLN